MYLLLSIFQPFHLYPNMEEALPLEGKARHGWQGKARLLSILGQHENDQGRRAKGHGFLCVCAPGGGIGSCSGC